MIYKNFDTFNDHLNTDTLEHYGMPRRSGRYPWGSGENPFQSSGSFLGRVNELKSAGMSQVQIANAIGLNSSQLRVQVSLAKSEERSMERARALSLRKKGYSLQKIADMMGYKNDSSIRTLLDDETNRRMNVAKTAAEILKQEVDKKGMIDVGAGVERSLNISPEKMKEALYILELEGYNTYGGRQPQITNPQNKTTVKVLTPPGTEHKEIFNWDNVHSLESYSPDKGETFHTLKYPSSINSKRVSINYAEDGGDTKDGLVEIRRGVDDLSLGNSSYAQVRILVDNNKYIKGMAVYKDDMPKGVDIIFNTNKSKSVPKSAVFKNISDDPTNPFGSLIKANGQSYYTDEKGNKKLSAINKRADEGDWDDWSNTLSSQFLSKQKMELINKQLNLAIADRTEEFDKIKNLNNPTVKKKLLETYAEDCDSAAVYLKAAALPRQRYQVLLPVPELKDNEIYAPNFKSGEKVALVRYPHGGTFEIPVLKVNNKNPAAKKMMGTAPKDAVGINSKVAGRLSGADFDGDTVMVIPTGGKVKITSTPPLTDLEGFDPTMTYGGKKPGTFKLMTEGQKQTEMGKISNLITDMTLKGAKEEELAKAVKHSMVVIDAVKHKLDYKQSERDNSIDLLKRTYQGVDKQGASTLISRAKSQTSVPATRGQPWIDPNTGKEIWERINPKTGEVESKIKTDTYNIYQVNRPVTVYQVKNPTSGKWEEVTQSTYNKTVKSNPTGARTKQKTNWEKSNKKEYEAALSKGDVSSYKVTTKTPTKKTTKMAATDDARTLISEARTPEEIAYASYANKLKSLGNEARKEMVGTGNIVYSPSAKKTYAKEVASLDAQLKVAQMNKPKERLANRLAQTEVDAKVKANPDMTKEEIRKASQIAITSARDVVGARRSTITISDKEWEAIQAGAITENKLKQILDSADIDVVREKATPRETRALSDASVARLKSMANSGYSPSEIASTLGISSSTVHKYIDR